MLLLLGDIQLLRYHKMTRIYPAPIPLSTLACTGSILGIPLPRTLKNLHQPPPTLTRTANCVIYSFKTTCNYRLNAPKRCSIDLNVFHVPPNTIGINYYDFN